MKILVVSYIYLNGVGGGVFASRAYINAFAELSDKLTLVYPETKEKKAEQLNKKIKYVPVDYSIPRWRKLLIWLKGRCHLLKDTAINCLDSDTYDLVVFNSSLACKGIIDHALKKGAKIITLHHNFEQEYTRDNQISNNFLDKLYMHNVIAAERIAVCKSDLNLTITDEDGILLRKYYNNKANIRTLGCFEAKSRRPLDLSSRTNGSNRFVITGSLSQVQTYRSLKNWFDSYYDILMEECPGMTLTIAGQSPTDQIRQMCKERNITLIPNPVSMDDVLLNADYYICPVSLGGGLKLRIMDGLRAGIPVLTHSVSARGYEAFYNQFLYSYNDGVSFRESLRQMLHSTSSYEAVQNRYLEIFEFKAGVNRLRKFIIDTLTK